MSANKIQTHPIAKIQAVIALILSALEFVVLGVDGVTQRVLFFIGLVVFAALGGITLYMGWLMMAKKEVVLYPHDVFLIQRARRRNRQKRAYRLQKNAESQKRRISLGWLNLLAGLLCLVAGMMVLFSNIGT